MFTDDPSRRSRGELQETPRVSLAENVPQEWRDSVGYQSSLEAPTAQPFHSAAQSFNHLPPAADAGAQGRTLEACEEYPPLPESRPTSFADSELLPPPNLRDSAGFEASTRHASKYTESSPSFSQIPRLAADPEKLGPYPRQSAVVDPPPGDGQQSKRRYTRRSILLILGIVLLVISVIVVAVVVPVVLKHKSHASSSGSPGQGTSPESPHPGPNTTASGTITIGGYGSTVTTETGTQFKYMNTFGGFWVTDTSNPYNDDARAQSWTPPLNTSWTWGVDVVRGVNLGGWLVPEPFIVPALFERYMNSTPKAIDEWTLSQNMANDVANGGLGQLEEHYNTFITEEDFARIAAAGLNWVRLPIPFWAIQKYDDEPFLEGVCWKYALKAFAWARKYGIRINLDLHTLPGSQNGYNHSGKEGQINFLYGVMGIANAQRGLDYMRIFVEFITQKEYSNVLPMFGVANEILTLFIGMEAIGGFYLHMHDTLRNITGYGTGHGAYLSIHDGFQRLSTWADFLPGRDRMAMDTHQYFCFGNQDNTPLASQLQKPCTTWGNMVNASWSTFGVTTAGEWSLAVNDCGYFLNGVGSGSRWDDTLAGYAGVTGPGAGACDVWNNWQNWNQTLKNELKQFALASMDALQDWFFWTWRIGNSSVLGTVGAPLWSYELGLENGWIPTDPREAVGVCGGTSPASALQPSMTGGAGAGQIAAAVREANPWPPVTLGPNTYTVALLPTYTPTGPIPTLPMPTPTPTGATKTSGDGWFDQADTAPIYTPIAGCTYPDAWGSAAGAVPPLCNVGK